MTEYHSRACEVEAPQINWLMLGKGGVEFPAITLLIQTYAKNWQAEGLAFPHLEPRQQHPQQPLEDGLRELEAVGLAVVAEVQGEGDFGQVVAHKCKFPIPSLL